MRWEQAGCNYTMQLQLGESVSAIGSDSGRILLGYGLASPSK